MRRLFPLCLITILLLSAISCAKSGGGSSDSGDSAQDPIPGASASFTTDCGTVIAGELRNTVSADEGLSSQAQAMSANIFVVQYTGQDGQPGQELIKLVGMTGPYREMQDAALQLSRQLAAGGLYFFRSSESCSFSLQGQQGTYGTLITASGQSIAEELIRAGYAPSGNEGCGGELIASCLRALQDSAPKIAGELDDFLWKPESDSNGNLAIHTGPYGTTVIVNGERGQNQGPGNGYGSLARFSRPGCAYGNPQIQVLDSDGAPYTVGGRTTFTVGNPCGRQCLQGGTIVACSK